MAQRLELELEHSKQRKEQEAQRRTAEQLSKEIALRSGKQLDTCTGQELQVFVICLEISSMVIIVPLRMRSLSHCIARHRTCAMLPKKV